MKTYFLKWVAASLSLPILVLILGRSLNQAFVLLFWPGSIALMALGAEVNDIWQIVYVWTIAVFLNVVLYLFVGALVRMFLNFFK